ncbi:hypothetical protein G7Z17_g3308 [Cylindrodendrum hubeiense]|uniref:Uncharacterized protein n=1 Tax=Cylindrodendrum hubeiense TaxID=595255 RepID=A0A9P5HEY5_9HYPO|nr:hypothetical protein G7Z17_g3308 [Cylindrodendrum hubeiense]
MDSTIYSDEPPQKTQRSHDQNKERAYIAASRRKDRSIEARIRSAQMASDIHKKRTGKAFYISEDVVLNEDMYEEVEEGFLRSYQILGPNLQSSSGKGNLQVDASLNGRVAIPRLASARDQDWRENEINRAFAQHFPQVDLSLSRRWSMASCFDTLQAQSCGLPNPPNESQHVNYPRGPMLDSLSLPTSSPPELGADVDTSPSTLTPLNLTPEPPSHPKTHCPQAPSDFSNTVHTNSFWVCNSDEPAFATDLPLEAKVLQAESCQGGMMDPALFDQQRMYADVPLDKCYEGSTLIKMGDMADEHGEVYVDNVDSANMDPVYQPNSTADDHSWNTFMNDIAWENYEN